MADRIDFGWWGNLLGYQACWFVSVICAGHGTWWPGALASAAFVIWQVIMLQHRARSLRLLGLALIVGATIDGLLSLAGWVQYASETPAFPPNAAPLWILGLWGAFAMTLRRSLAFLQARPWLAAVFGAIGAPLAYLGAARGWQAVTFPPPVWPSLLALAAGWAAALPMLAGVARERP